MKTFSVGEEYTSKTFLGHKCNYKCIARTNKTITLYDGYDEFTKRIKSNNKFEYVVFSKNEMGFCEMELRA